MEKLKKECSRTYRKLNKEKQKHVQHVVSMQFDKNFLEKENEELKIEKNKLFEKMNFQEKELLRQG